MWKGTKGRSELFVVGTYHQAEVVVSPMRGHAFHLQAVERRKLVRAFEEVHPKCTGRIVRREPACQTVLRNGPSFWPAS